MERHFTFEAYRNIGFDSEGNPKEEQLVINTTLKRDFIGGLLIIIGANNSGKSNVLDAIMAFNEDGPKMRDFSDTFLEDKSQNPIIGIEAKDQDGIYSIKKSSGNKLIINYPGKDDFVIKHTNNENFANSINVLRSAEANYSGTRLLFDSTLVGYEQHGKMKEALEFIYKALPTIISRNNSFVNVVKNNPIYRDYLINLNRNTVLGLNEAFNKKYSFNLIPKIVKYEEKHIGGNDFTIPNTNIENSSFFSSLFRLLGIDKSEIQRAYEQYHKQHNNKAVLNNLQKKIQRQLNQIADAFNKLYYEETDKYYFRFEFEKDNLVFSMEKGDKNIFIDYQSTGFRWFFELYFNLLSSVSLNIGDIIILDEPATHLHVLGQEETREMLRSFAVKNGITIIVATHSEHMIGLDHLEDLRIIENKGCIATICNGFTAIDKEDSDSLKPIKKSLTCNRHHILNPDIPTIFVEGITDYDYVIGMKANLRIENDLCLLPIGGVGKTESEMKNKLEELISICKNPILLVDNDDKGLAIKRINDENGAKAIVIHLGEVNSSFKTIESLFSKNDLNKFGLIKENERIVKYYILAASIKHLMEIDANCVSEETKKNFKELFEYIIKRFSEVL